MEKINKTMNHLLTNNRGGTLNLISEEEYNKLPYVQKILYTHGVMQSLHKFGAKDLDELLGKYINSKGTKESIESFKSLISALKGYENNR